MFYAIQPQESAEFLRTELWVVVGYYFMWQSICCKHFPKLHDRTAVVLDIGQPPATLNGCRPPRESSLPPSPLNRRGCVAVDV